MSQKNTLFNYFQRSKSPQVSQKDVSSNSATPKRPRPEETSTKPSRTKTKHGAQKPFKRLRVLSDSDDDSENDQSLANAKDVTVPATPDMEVCHIAEADAEAPQSDSDELAENLEEEYKPKKHEISSDEESDHEVVESGDESPIKRTPKSKKTLATPKAGTFMGMFNRSPSTPKAEPPAAARTPKIGTPVTPRTPASAAKSKLSSFSVQCEQSPAPSGDAGDNWPHLKMEFLDQQRLRDAAGRRPQDAQFDTRSLRVATDFLDRQTPGMRQWWMIKAANFDCVIFFKMGKFYEMFHMDAVLCVKELGLLFMKGDHAHVGFPEASYGRYSAALVEKGYKVCRVEQTETPEMMQNRVAHSAKKTTKFDRVVRREVCQLTSRGTRTFSAVEGDATDADLNYLLAIREQEVDGVLQFGVCFVDTSVGHFRLGQFTDDCHCSRLRTVLAHYPPAQLLLARSTAVQRSRDALSSLSGCLKETLRVGDEFWSAQKTLRYLANTDYFSDENDDGGKPRWPQPLLDLTEHGDATHLTPGPDSDLALQCLGAVCWYLQLSLIDTQLLSMRRFSHYQLPDQCEPAESQQAAPVAETPDASGEPQHGARMVLDGVTLRNLEIVANSVDGGTDGTLLGTLDTCVTAFGKRVLRAWLCSPLRSAAAINCRLDAVDDLLGRPDIMDDLRAGLKQLPDLERLVRRIHVEGNVRLGAGGDHPDSRAIMFEQAKYSRSRVHHLLSTLAGFRQAAQLPQSVAGCVKDLKSNLIRCCLLLEDDGGKFPDYGDVLDYFEHSFDMEQAQKEGRITPADGVDGPSDAAQHELDEVQNELDDYLQEQCRHFGCKVAYFGQARNRYQLEVPDHALRRVDQSYELQTQKKGAKRYWTATTKELLSRQIAAEEKRAAALRDVSRRMFARFGRHMATWERAVQCLGVLDALLALARFSRSCEAVLEITNGHHPWLGRSGGGADFIPNSVSTAEGCLLLVTGPNMGGKSTLMRQAGLLVILAQLGCRVPAEAVRLSPVDRVFTRLGAQDRIMSGQSTFHVELSETAAIVQHATRASLVLVDELGRGTSTFDGSAIASAVLRQLLRTGCRCLFSTHYHSLVEEFNGRAQVWLGHMACMVENENVEDPTQETITFLYKLTAGACPKSYGFNAARLAGLPPALVRRAHQKARQFEERVERVSRFSSVWRAHCVDAQ